MLWGPLHLLVMHTIGLQELIMHHQHWHAALWAVSELHVTSVVAAVKVVQVQALGQTIGDMFNPKLEAGHCEDGATALVLHACMSRKGYGICWAALCVLIICCNVHVVSWYQLGKTVWCEWQVVLAIARLRVAHMCTLPLMTLGSCVCPLVGTIQNVRWH